MKNLLPLIFLFFINLCHSQIREATIFFNDSTFIKGFGEIKKNKIYFKVEEKDEITVWSYDMAKGLTFSGYGFSEKYIYLKTDKYPHPIIVEVVEEGKVSLYRKNKLVYNYIPIGAADPISGIEPKQVIENMDTTYFVQRKNEVYARDIVFSFKSRAMRYFSDCKTLVDKIEKRVFLKKNIIDIVYYYNDNCGYDLDIEEETNKKN